MEAPRYRYSNDGRLLSDFIGPQPAPAPSTFVATSETIAQALRDVRFDERGRPIIDNSEAWPTWLKWAVLAALLWAASR